MVTTIEKVIRSLFPDNLIDCDAFDDWCNPIREDISPGAVDLIERLKNQLESIKSECLSSGDINRDFGNCSVTKITRSSSRLRVFALSLLVISWMKKKQNSKRQKVSYFTGYWNSAIWDASG